VLYFYDFSSSSKVLFRKKCDWSYMVFLIEDWLFFGWIATTDKED
jgi:hypothetical protein